MLYDLSSKCSNSIGETHTHIYPPTPDTLAYVILYIEFAFTNNQSNPLIISKQRYVYFIPNLTLSVCVLFSTLKPYPANELPTE